MYQLYFAERDTTLYEKFPEQNTGIDPIIELIKITSGSKLNGEIQSSTYNTRILLDFGSQITDLTTAVTAGNIPPLGNANTSASVYLNLQASVANDLPLTYTINAFPISESWDNGNGTYSDTPITKIGASWYYRDATDPGTTWDTGSAPSGGEPGVSVTTGGGTWMTGSGYEASQSFDNQSPDLRINVTDIVSKWVDGTISNNGFIIKRKYSEEISGEILGTIKFFGRETHTIYVPRLEVAWNDAVLSGTGSFTEISANTYVPYFKNIKNEYRSSEKTMFRVGVRPEFPSKSYVTSSFYMSDERLPTSSYYSVRDAITDETIIPFDTSATQVSCDSNGNYFRVNLNTFMPERYYKILLKVERTGGDDTQVHDNSYFFKVVK